MTAKKEKSLGNETQSLSRQIDQAASRLDRRKARARDLGATLGSRIHYGCASPRVLWIAGFAGFVIGDWIHRPVNKTAPVIEQPSASPDRAKTAVMSSSNAVLLLKIAQDLGMLWAKANAGRGVRQRTDERRSREHAVDEPGR